MTEVQVGLDASGIVQPAINVAQSDWTGFEVHGTRAFRAGKVVNG